MTGRLTTPERAAAGLAPSGLVVDGRRVAVPGVRVTTWLDDPARAPRVTDGGPREAHDVIAFVWHTSKGRLTTRARQGSIPSTHAETLARYQARTTREVSWHLTVDTDGDVLQQADLARWTCWHAGSANGWTVGAELVQREDAPDVLTSTQIEAAVAITIAACDTLSIPRRVLVAVDGRPQLGPVLDLVSPRAKHGKTGRPLGGRGKTWAGVLGHCHLAHRDASGGRGPGDPGPLIFEALIAAGFERHLVGVDGSILGAV